MALGCAFVPSAATAEDCSNAAIREAQRATYLPDCRAFEQVSPIEKNSNHIGFLALAQAESSGPIVAAPDGESIFYTSMGSFANSAASAFPNGYAGGLQGDDWVTTPLTPPATPFSGFTGSYVAGVTPDLTKQLAVSGHVLAPGGQQGTFNLYIHDSLADSYEFVGTLPNINPTTPDVRFGGATADGRFFFSVNNGHLASTPTPATTGPSVSNLYEYSDGELKLVGVLPDGSASPNGSSFGLAGYTYKAGNAVSRDGSRVYWSPGSAGVGVSNAVPVYLREDGREEAIVVSKRESDGTAQFGKFAHATPDGDYAFFTSEAQLTEDASSSGYDLYRYDADEDDVEDLTPTTTSADVEGVLGVSEDGSYVYFIAHGALTNDATAGQPNIYVRHDEQIRLVATAPAGIPGEGGTAAVTLGVGSWRVSENGRFLAFLTGSALEGEGGAFPAQPVKQAYLYSYDGAELVCASCPEGATPASRAYLHAYVNERRYLTKSNAEGLTRNLLGDGRFFFSTSDALVGRDTNGRMDVYQYTMQNGPELISSSKSPEISFFGDATPDGEHVFILTQEGLAGQDVDTLVDLYDARVDGGIPSQNPSPSPDCQGDGCQGRMPVSPAGVSPGSASYSGSGNPSGSDQRRSCKQPKRKLKRAQRKLRRAKLVQGKHGNARTRKIKRKAKRAVRNAKKRHNRCMRGAK